MVMINKRRLGRGLGSLIGDVEPPANVGMMMKTGRSEEHTNHSVDGQNYVELEITQIRRSEFQPREQFDPDALEDLADSIRAQGIVQPIVVRRVSDGYELVAGERRWRAAQMAGLDKVPTLIRDLDPKQTAAIALIENIQREDLNPIEQANAYQRLIEDFDLTHQQVANAVGRSRTGVTNFLRLLDLNEAVKQKINDHQLNMGHARALLALPDQDQATMAETVAKQGLSVRETEAMVRKAVTPDLRPEDAKKPAGRAARDPDLERLERVLSERLGAPVRIQAGKKGSGQLIIQYHSAAELDGIIGHLKRD